MPLRPLAPGFDGCPFAAGPPTTSQTTNLLRQPPIIVFGRFNLAPALTNADDCLLL